MAEGQKSRLRFENQCPSVAGWAVPGRCWWPCGTLQLRTIQNSGFFSRSVYFSQQGAAFPLCPNPRWQFPELFLGNAAKSVGISDCWSTAQTSVPTYPPAGAVLPFSCLHFLQACSEYLFLFSPCPRPPKQGLISASSSSPQANPAPRCHPSFSPGSPAFLVIVSWALSSCAAPSSCAILE